LYDVTVEVGAYETAVSRAERGESALTPYLLSKLAVLYGTSPERLHAEMRRWVAAQAGQAARMR
jgi:hypothetical protein